MNEIATPAIPRPRISVRAATRDSFQNFATRTGVTAPNVLSASTYAFNYKTLQRMELEAAYRGNWVVGQAVDVVAEDMTRAGIIIDSGIDPTKEDDIHRAMDDLCVWASLQQCIKWGRLYGGAIGILLVDGQAPSSPLVIDKVGPGQFKGVLAVDRWRLWSRVDQPITELGPDYGKPEFYEMVATSQGMEPMRLHHSRVIRFEGHDAPWLQRQINNGWGSSVIERLFDRLVAFDSVTMGAAQLAHKAHLRTLAVDGLRAIIAEGGDALEDLVGFVDLIRLYQSNEGFTLTDAKDRLEMHSYAFTGLSDMMVQFAQQLAGALQIPLVRLLGQSPGGLNSTGETDIRLYYDTIYSQQKRDLRTGLGRIIRLVHRSALGASVKPDFAFSFRPLWQMDSVQKAAVAKTTAESVVAARRENLISDRRALQELKSSSVTTGIFGTITDEEIQAADDTIPDPMDEAATLAEIEANAKVTAGGGQMPAAADA